MTKKDKQLLFKDLCMRLPYDVIVHYKNKERESDDVVLGTGNIGYVKELGGWWKKCKPYLRPMSSMTKEEMKEYELLANRCISTSVGFVHFDAQELIDWLLKNHFDYCGLIGKSLAIEVTKDNNPYK